jgi:Flp pilus assembly protein TadB
VTELLGVLGLVIAVVVAFLSRQAGMDAERTRSRKIAVEAEARRKEQSAKDAGEAMRSAARQRDRDTARPATDFLTEEARKGGKP